MARQITAPLTKEAAASLRAGESVLLSGTVYTARDAAHKRLCALAAEGKPLPFPIQGAVIYFVGPTPARPGQAIGSAGPTTSYRMDAYSPTLLRLGQLGMIGKGKRGPEVIQAMQETGAVYFGAIGGAGALLSRCVKSAKLVLRGSGGRGHPGAGGGEPPPHRGHRQPGQQPLRDRPGRLSGLAEAGDMKQQPVGKAFFGRLLNHLKLPSDRKKLRFSLRA